MSSRRMNTPMETEQICDSALDMMKDNEFTCALMANHHQLYSMRNGGMLPSSHPESFQTTVMPFSIS